MKETTENKVHKIREKEFYLAHLRVNSVSDSFWISEHGWGLIISTITIENLCPQAEHLDIVDF